MNHLGLFAKFWQPGTVKTRLAASIGDPAACQLYHSFVFHLLSRLGQTADQRTVVYAPESRAPEFENSIPANWKLCPQAAGDLGVRMSAFICRQFDQVAAAIGNSAPRPDKVAIIGADCPQLDRAKIERAFDLLDQAPVVIGPSTDGGYYLIAMRQSCADVFTNIRWSTNTVFEETLGKLREQGIDYQTLPPLTDVDDLESLNSLKSELERDNRMPSSLDELDQRLWASICRATDANTREPNHGR